MFLSAVCDLYCRRRVGLSAGYRSLLRATCAAFAGWLGRDALAADLTPDSLAGWLQSLYAGRAAATVNDKRRMLLTLLKSHSAGQAAELAAAVPRLREPEDEPEAWTVEEVGELLWTAQHWPGEVCGIPAGFYWDSLFAVIYWTGVRVGAVRQTRQTDYDSATGWIRIRGRTQKTGRGQTFALPHHARVKLERVALPRRDLIWPWPFHSNRFWIIARRIVERAGLPCPRTSRQLFHRLRRTHLSYCWATDPALAQRQAGHASAETTRRHYVDPRIAQVRTAADVLPVPAF